MWLEERAGPARLAVAATLTADNIADDPRRPRTARSEVGARLGLTLPFGPVVGVEYARGESVRRPPAPRRDVAPPTRAFYDSVALSLYYWRPAWDVTASASVSPSEGPGGESVATSEELSLSYRPTSRLTITPALTLAGVDYGSMVGGAPAGSRSVSASASVSLAPVFRAFDLTLYGGYSRSVTTDGLFDATTISTTASLIWRLGRLRVGPTSLAFQLGHDRYLDAVYPGADTSNVYGQAVLTIAVGR